MKNGGLSQVHALVLSARTKLSRHNHPASPHSIPVCLEDHVVISRDGVHGKE